MVYFKTFAVTAITLLSCTLAAPTSSSGVDDTIPGSYIITLKQDIIPPVVKAHMNWVGKVHQRSLKKRDSDKGVEKTYETEAGFRGYSGTFDPATIKQIKNSPEVRDTGTLSMHMMSDLSRLRVLSLTAESS
jgi:hypothetical protein